MLVEQAEIKDKIRVTAKTILIILKVNPFLSSFLRYLAGAFPSSTKPCAFISFHWLEWFDSLKLV